MKKYLPHVPANSRSVGIFFEDGPIVEGYFDGGTWREASGRPLCPSLGTFEFWMELTDAKAEARRRREAREAVPA